MEQLPNGCRCSEILVTPTNWKKTGASVKKDWRIYYTFYDPSEKVKYPHGKQKVVKGMNKCKTLAERRAETAEIISAEKQLLRDGYNPIKNAIMHPKTSDIEPTTPLPDALQFAIDKKILATGTRSDMKSCLKYVTQSAGILGYNDIDVTQIRRKHIRLILDKVAEIRAPLSPMRFNKYRTYLMILFDELMQLDAVEFNPVAGIKKQKEIRKRRLTLTLEERLIVNAHLLAKYPSFYRFLHIFFHSGARESEIIKVQAKDVDLINQRVKYIVLKGRQPVEVERVIKSIVLPLWKEQMKECKPNDYLFARGLKPGAESIQSYQITKRWYRLVKNPLGISADFYSLKHLNTDETAALLNINDAAALNAHKGGKITRLYAQGEDERQMERLRNLGNGF